MLGKQQLRKVTNRKTLFEKITYYLYALAGILPALLKKIKLFRCQSADGGAYATGEKEEKLSIHPETFKILNGRLYLFYNRFFNNTLKSWNKDKARLKTDADASWKKFSRIN